MFEDWRWWLVADEEEIEFLVSNLALISVFNLLKYPKLSYYEYAKNI